MFGTSSTVTSNTAMATSAAIDVADGDVAIVDVEIHIQTELRAVVMVTLSEPDATGTIAMKAFVPAVIVPSDNFSRSTYYLDVTADWSVAHADNEVACEAFAVYEIV